MKVSLKVRELLSGIDRKELALILAQGLLIVIIFGYFFYRSYVWTLIISPLLLPYVKLRICELKDKKKWNSMLQFKELLVSVNASVQAGSSIENAFIDSKKDMIELYGSDSAIVGELNIIRNGLGNNCQLTGLIRGYASRTGVEEILNFSDVMVVCKQSGGNLKEIMNSYIHIIDEKISVMQEIETLTAAKQFEQKIMNVVPFVILFYVELSSKGFFEVLYHNLVGNVIMTIIMVLYILAIYISKKILNSFVF